MFDKFLNKLQDTLWLRVVVYVLIFIMLVSMAAQIVACSPNNKTGDHAVILPAAHDFCDRNPNDPRCADD